MAIVKAGVPGQSPALPNPTDAAKYLDGSGAFSAMVGSGASVVDVQVFTVSGNWSRPASARLTHVTVIGGGGGGGAGRQGALATTKAGGDGGASGGRAELLTLTYRFAALVAVVVPLAATGAASQINPDTNGLSGVDGGDVTFGVVPSLVAYGGNGGGGGAFGSGVNASAGSGLVVAGLAYAAWNGVTGSPGQSTANGDAGKSAAASIPFSPGSGGGGGGMDAADVSYLGGAGGTGCYGEITFSGGAGSGADGTDVSAGFALGGGGGAGGDFGGMQGGKGGDYGAGGGGGGASTNGSPSGAGGDGAPGICVAVSW